MSSTDPAMPFGRFDRRALLRSEDGIKKKLSAQKPNVEAGIWIEQMIANASLGGASVATALTPAPTVMGEFPPGMRGRGDVPNRYGRGESPPPPPVETAAATPGQEGNTNMITMICRAVSLTSVDAAANSAIAFAVESEIKNSPFVDPKATSLVGSIVADDATGTFTFTLNVAPTNLPSF